MRILFEPIGGALGIGAITRCLAMAQAAAMRGHRVAFLAPEGYPLIDELDLGERYFAPFPERTPELVGSGEADGFTEAVLIRGMGEPAYVRAALDAEVSAYRAFRPDMVVTEMQPTVPIAAHIARVPFACTVQSPNLAAFAGPSDRPESCARVEATFAALAREHGLPEPASLEDLLHQHAAVNIAPTAEVLEPALGALPRTRYVGPVLLPSLELAPAPRYDDAEVRVLVYLSFGALTLDEFLPVIAKAFPAPRHSVVVAAREKDIAGREVPFRQDNVIVARTPGITRLLQDTDLLVTRGGQNALMASLLAGVPVIGTPGRSPEPIFNLGALQAHGAALTLLDEPGPEALAEAAQTLLTGHAAQHAARLGDLLRRHRGAVEAVEALESAVSNPACRPPLD
ncbi:glycosyltransferase [Streptomyces cremeus]|uniref:Glycosyltransferase n=1 Tax=Streptomyces cremeus TaxID=66881 RepID=A0ABV5PEB3_STRCM